MGWNIENSYQKLPELFYSYVEPTQVQSPDFVRWNTTLAEELGLNSEPEKESIGFFSGNMLPDNSKPIAQAYAGHQFGHFTMLGDGRAILLGEQRTPDGNVYDIQLKGAGRTPYSRGGDGRAALGPMLREYLISEAMHGLQIPTSRSLAVVKIGDPVYRETSSEGAILTRVSKSHLRVGTIQFARQWGTKEELKAVVNYAINRHYPFIADRKDKYVSFLKEVMINQASLIAKWQLVGFIHGVMNTDNVTISGETLDYGPCAFMDTYDRATVFSSIDRNGRYAFGKQPNIGGWNLARLAEALLLLIDDEEGAALEVAKEVIGEYPALYEQYWLEGMRRKLGLFEEQEGDNDLIYRLLDLMEQYQGDYTNTFRSLTLQQFHENTPLFQSNAFKEWKENWEERLQKQNKSAAEVRELMKENNPSIIPRNYLVEEVLEAAVTENDYEKMNRFLDALKDPYAYSEEQKEFACDPPDQDIPYQTFCGT